MINKKYSQPLFMTLMSLGMSIIMSGVVVAVNTGISNGFFFRWGYSIMYAYPIALIAAFTLAPLIKTLVNKIASKE